MDGPSKAGRSAARQRVAGYHEECLAGLLTHVSAALDGHRAGKLTVAEADTAIHQYHRAAQELWKFCNTVGSAELVARTIDAMPEPVDWWDRGEPRRPTRPERV